MSGDHVTEYDLMPIPPDEERTEWFEAGSLAIGVEYRRLTDAIAAAAALEPAEGTAGSSAAAATGLDDRGVSLHVCVAEAGARREHLRFDCFQEDPHYHYVSHAPRFNHMLHLDPIADGDPLAWALERIRTRLPQMLARAGAAEAAAKLDAAALDALLPRVAEAAYRARYAGHEVAERAVAAPAAGARR
jgi:hypothetical protein